VAARALQRILESPEVIKLILDPQKKTLKLVKMSDEQPTKRARTEPIEGGGSAIEVDAAVAQAATPTDGLEKLVRSLRSYPLMDEVCTTLPFSRTPLRVL
jgi:hypothetical protein